MTTPTQDMLRGASEDRELHAMRQLVDALEPLDVITRARLVRYLTDRYYPRKEAPAAS
jgi:hypothetical protein